MILHLSVFDSLHPVISDNVPRILPGDKVKVVIYLELPKEPAARGKKERIQVFEGVVIGKHSGINGGGSTITVRKMFPKGLGVEKIFLLGSPSIKSIEVLGRSKVRRAKLYYLRGRSGKAARLKPLKGT